MSRPTRHGPAFRARELGRSPSAVQLRALDLVSRGMTVAQVAGQLGLSYDTVKTHLSHLYARLGVTGAAHAVRVALERGLLDARPTAASTLGTAPSRADES